MNKTLVEEQSDLANVVFTLLGNVERLNEGTVRMLNHLVFSFAHNMYMHAYMHTYKRTNVYAYIHAYIHKNKHTNKLTNKKYKAAYVHTIVIHTYIQTCKQTQLAWLNLHKSNQLSSLHWIYISLLQSWLFRISSGGWCSNIVQSYETKQSPTFSFLFILKSIQ